jgi:DNA polymerase
MDLSQIRQPLVPASARQTRPATGSIKHLLFVDFETLYSKEYSLRRLSPPEYILDPRYQTLMMSAYDIEWAAPKIILPEDIPSFLADYPPEYTQCCSFNALFDLAILAWRYDWIPTRLQDTLGMVRALRNYRRNSLKEVMKQLFGRDSKGDTIHKVIGMDAAAIKRAGLWPEFCTYAMNDVRDCVQIYFKLLPEFPVEERLVMDLVLRAAVDPILEADTAMLEDHLQHLRRRKQLLLREAGYDKATLMSTQMFKEALESLGVPIKTKVSPATQKEIPQFAKSDPFMAELLEYEDADEDTNYAVQTLAAARLSEKSTIEETRAERFMKIAQLPWGYNRGALLPMPLRYGGAHTHRLSGEWKMNCQNLPRDAEKSRLRAALIAPPGMRIITADLAQIEARIVACLAGQAALIESFRDGKDVYALFASIVFGRVITKDHNPHERFIGKTAVLGLGYGCGWERFYNMVVTDARKYGISLEGLFDKEVAQTVVNTYRTLFNRIPQAWKQLDRLLARVLNGHGNSITPWGPCQFKASKIVLPNRMTLRYILPDENLYGAKLLENITQALARIVVMSAAVQLYREHSLRFVLQTHDELVFALPEHEVEGAAPVIAHEMTQPPAWMPDLPLAVEVKIGTNYGNCKLWKPQENTASILPGPWSPSAET